MSWKRFKEALSHAFSIDDGREDITPDDIALMDKMADFVVRRRLTLPAILLLQSSTGLNFIGSSLMTFFRPMLSILFNMKQYERFEQLLDKRCSLDLLVERIELRENPPKSEPDKPRRAIASK